MNVALLAASGSAQTAAFNAGNEAGAADSGGSAPFARMLDAGNGNDSNDNSKGNDPSASRSRTGAGDGAGRAQAAKARTGDAGSGKARAPAAESGRDADDAAAASAGADEADDADTTETADTPDGDGWPPPGLASLLGLAPPPPAATTATADSATGGTDAAAGFLPGQAPADASRPQASPGPGAARSEGATAFLPSSVVPAAPAAAGAAGAAAATTAASDGGAPAGADDAFAKRIDGLTAVAPQATDAPASMAPLLHGLQATTAPAGPAGTVPVSAAPVVPQLHGDQFAEDIGTHVEWLAGQKIGHAHIRISPQELGPVEIRLHLDGDRVNADFSSAQPEVRQALENGLPRLREMLGQQGFQLAHAGVGQQSNPGGSGARRETAAGQGGESGDLAGTSAPAPVRLARRGLLDAYA